LLATPLQQLTPSQHIVDSMIRETTNIPLNYEGRRYFPHSKNSIRDVVRIVVDASPQQLSPTFAIRTADFNTIDDTTLQGHSSYLSDSPHTSYPLVEDAASPSEKSVSAQDANLTPLLDAILSHREVRRKQPAKKSNIFCFEKMALIINGQL